MADPTKPSSIQSEAVQLMGQIPFGAILGAPLVAAVSAQAAASQACIDFITKVGLDGDSVRTARFDFVRAVPAQDAEAVARKSLGFPAEGVLSDDQQKQLTAKIAATGP